MCVHVYTGKVTHWVAGTTHTHTQWCSKCHASRPSIECWNVSARRAAQSEARSAGWCTKLRFPGFITILGLKIELWNWLEHFSRSSVHQRNVFGLETRHFRAQRRPSWILFRCRRDQVRCKALGCDYVVHRCASRTFEYSQRYVVFRDHVHGCTVRLFCNRMSAWQLEARSVVGRRAGPTGAPNGRFQRAACPIL